MGQVVLCSRSYAQVYLLAGRAPIPRLVAVLMINRRPSGTLSLLDASAFVFGCLVSFRIGGDAELARFVKDPLNKGKLLRSGLWRYYPAPQLFGEVALWWGIWLIALGVPAAGWDCRAPHDHES